MVVAAQANGNSPGIGAARVLDAILLNGTQNADMQQVITALGRLENARQVSDAVKQTLPVLHGAGAMATTNALHSMNRIIQSRIESNRGLSSGDVFYGDRQVWIKPFYSKAKLGERDGATGFDSHTAGLAAGIDGAMNDRVRVGAVLTYANSRVTGGDAAAPQRTEVGTYELVGYASYNLDPRTDINFQLDAGYNTNKGYRTISFGGLNRIAHSDYGSFAMHGSAGVGRVIALAEPTNLTPSLRLDYTHVRSKAYTETGAGALNLRMDASTYKEGLLSADLKLAHEFDSHLKFVGNLALAYDMVNNQARAVSAYVGGGPVFVTEGVKPSPWLQRAGLGLIKTNAQGMEFTVRYDAEKHTRGMLNQTLSARWRAPF